MVRFFSGGMLCLFLSVNVFAADPPDVPSTEIDWTSPPEHLKNTALLEFLQTRQLKNFPPTVAELVKQLGYFDASTVTSFVPNGRSAQADQTSLRRPRSLVAIHSATKVTGRAPLGFEDYTALPGSDWEGRLYFGHASQPEQAEALSWNRDKHRFDFFVITQMAVGKTARLQEVTDRTACTQCHQNEAPIFTLPPWSESISHDPLQSFRTPPQKTLSAAPRMYRLNGVLLTEEPTPTNNDVGLAFDSSSGAGNRLVQATRIISDVCGMNLECRRQVLLVAITNPIQSTYIRNNFVLDNSQFGVDFVNGPLNRLQAGIPQLSPAAAALGAMVAKMWPADQFAYTSQLLTDPTTGLNADSVVNQLDPRAARGALLAIDPKLAGAFIADTAFEILGFTLNDARRLRKLSPGSLTKRFSPMMDKDHERMPDDLKALLQKWPPTRSQLLAFLNLQDNNAADSAVTNVAPLFNQYCARCHGDKSENGTFPFADVTALRADNRSSKAVERRLLRATMPPRDATPQPTANERAAMLAFLRDNGPSGSALTATAPIRRSHLGVRFSDVPTLRRSYITSSSDTLEYEGVLRECGPDGRVLSNANQERGVPLFAAKTTGSNPRTYLALENFPHYFLGNIVQGPQLVNDRGTCFVVALTRGGKLARLNFDARLQRISMTMMQGPPPPAAPAATDGKTAPATPPLAPLTLTAVDFASAETLGDSTGVRGFGVGSDGKLYRIVLKTATAYTLEALTLPPPANPQPWTRVLQAKTKEGRDRLYAQSFDGRTVGYDIDMSDGKSLMTAVSPPTAPVFPTSLLDGDSVVLNPLGQTDDPKTERILPRVLAMSATMKPMKPSMEDPKQVREFLERVYEDGVSCTFSASIVKNGKSLYAKTGLGGVAVPSLKEAIMNACERCSADMNRARSNAAVQREPFKTERCHLEGCTAQKTVALPIDKEILSASLSDAAQRSLCRVPEEAE